MATATLTAHGPMGLDLPQHLGALQVATAVRMARAQVKRDLKAGRISLNEALLHPDGQSLELVDLLAARPRWGKTKAARYLAAEKIIATKRVRDLTDRQIAELCG